jgi:hypothetical protein
MMRVPAQVGLLSVGVGSRTSWILPYYHPSLMLPSSQSVSLVAPHFAVEGISIPLRKPLLAEVDLESGTVIN